MPLTDSRVRDAKPGDKPYKLTDSGGLYVIIMPTGGKLWRLNYRFGDRQKTLSLGAYPVIGVTKARAMRDKAKLALIDGNDPGESMSKKAKKIAALTADMRTFRAIAQEWIETYRAQVNPVTAKDAWARLERNIFPHIGDMDVAKIKTKDVLNALRLAEARGVGDTLRKAKTAVSKVMRLAVQKGLAERDPCPEVRGALKAVTAQHYAAITDPGEFGELLRSIDGYSGQIETMAALRLLPLVFTRPGELRAARWKDIDLNEAKWEYVAPKTDTPHIVPLSKQAVTILRDLHPLTGHGELVFPGLIPGRPISNATLNGALRRMGYDTKSQHTAHGFRASARTMLYERLGFPAEHIEIQLAHRTPGHLSATYNRAKFIDERTAMMQAWADFCDTLKAGAGA